LAQVATRPLRHARLPQDRRKMIKGITARVKRLFVVAGLERPSERLAFRY
jgi:hypothetical protein